MKTVWAVAVTALLVLAAEAHADTLYLKDGQTVWGSEITEEGDRVIVQRSGETLRFPKGDVIRIERSRSSIPRYYEPPSGVAGTAPEGADRARPSSPAAASAAEAPAPTQAPGAATPSPAPPPVVGAPDQLTPTRLPPPSLPGTARPRY